MLYLSLESGSMLCVVFKRPLAYEEGDAQAGYRNFYEVSGRTTHEASRLWLGGLKQRRDPKTPFLRKIP